MSQCNAANGADRQTDRQEGQLDRDERVCKRHTSCHLLAREAWHTLVHTHTHTLAKTTLGRGQLLLLLPSYLGPSKGQRDGSKKNPHLCLNSTCFTFSPFLLAHLYRVWTRSLRFYVCNCVSRPRPLLPLSVLAQRKHMRRSCVGRDTMLSCRVLFGDCLMRNVSARKCPVKRKKASPMLSLHKNNEGGFQANAANYSKI